MNRVLFVDYWTQGIHNFTRLSEASQGNVEYTLLHLGSYHDAKTPRLEIVQGIPSIDIAAFKGLSLKDILRSLAPDVVVSLNIGGLFDRAICLTCRSLDIPLVFLQHGVWAEKKQFMVLCEEMDRKRGFRARVDALPKFLRIAPWYARECRGGVFSPNLWKVLYDIAKKPAVSRYFPPLAHEVWPTLACVFAEVYAEMLIGNARIPRERILVIGNPELDAAAFRRDNPRLPSEVSEMLRDIGLAADVPIVCFIEDAFVEQQGLFGWDEQVRHVAIKELYDACRSAGAQLLVRPHPAMSASAMDSIRTAFDGMPGFSISRSWSLIDTLECADAVVGTISTALETAIIMQRPILTPTWHINGQVGFSAYLTYGAAIPVTNRSELEGTIKRVLRNNLQHDTSRYIVRRLGPVDGHAATRAADALLAAANRVHPRASTGDPIASASTI